MNALVPNFHRTDAHRWTRLILYPGAATLLLPRFLFASLGMLVCALFVKLLLAFKDIKKPITGCRATLLWFFYWFFARIINLLSNFTWISHKKLDINDPRVNYEIYLGPKWKEELIHRKEKNLRSSVIVSNHVGYIDILAFLGSTMNPSFISRDTNGKVPVLAALINGL
jgi:1-acyl-sn-glycerol-3-phosphate acyltransferase